jgi:predicted secreted Zn-dependent protease
VRAELDRGLPVAAALVLGLLAGNAPAAVDHAGVSGPVITETRRYYELDATLLEPLRQQLAERALAAGLAGGAIGSTRQDLETRYRLEPLPTGCRLAALSVRMDLTLDLPVWRPAGVTRRELRARWERMIGAITQHEEGHRDNAVRAARELHQRLSALGEDQDCEVLGKQAQREMLRVKLRFDLREKAYDRRTGHGVSQGSVL